MYNFCMLLEKRVTCSYACVRLCRTYRRTTWVEIHRAV